MASVRSVLLRLEVRPAGKLSHCRRSKKHAIKKGEPRFVVKAPGVATPEHGYCSSCGLAMIEKAEEDLTALRRELE